MVEVDGMANNPLLSPVQEAHRLEQERLRDPLADTTEVLLSAREVFRQGSTESGVLIAKVDPLLLAAAFAIAETVPRPEPMLEAANRRLDPAANTEASIEVMRIQQPELIHDSRL